VRVNARSRGACLTGALLTVLLTAGPALADYDPLGRSEGGEPGDGLSPLETIALFVLIPGAIIVFISALVVLPGTFRGSRYRPTRGWNAPPVWFAGPADPASAVASAQPAEVTKGGASGSW
jgi:hypothetical protein